MSYTLILLPRAEWEVDVILTFLRTKTPQGARAWDRALQAALDSVRKDPLRFALAPESSRYDHKIRQILFKTRRGRIYRALFTVVESTVYVLHVRGPNQRPLRPDELGPP